MVLEVCLLRFSLIELVNPAMTSEFIVPSIVSFAASQLPSDFEPVVIRKR